QFEPASAGGTVFPYFRPWLPKPKFRPTFPRPRLHSPVQCHHPMRHLKLLPLLLVFCLHAAAQTHEMYLPPAPKPMTVQDVIKLERAAPSDDPTPEHPGAKTPRFDLTPARVLQPKPAGVSERVIQAMINPGLRSTASSPAPAPRTKASPVPASPP